MIQPEIKLIKMIDWKHMKWISLEPTESPMICPKEQVAMVEVLDLKTKKQLEVQVMCSQCGRSLTIYAKN